MKFKLDENLPLQAAAGLRFLGYDIDTTDDEGLSGCSDFMLWTATQREGRTLITQDLDFSDARRFVPGSKVTTGSYGYVWDRPTVAG